MNAPIRIVKTSEADWLKKLAVAYKAREDVTLVDDAKFGINPESDSLYQMGVKAKLSRAEIVAVCAALGIGTAGIGLVVGAFLDPEPTSKLMLIVASGTFLLFTGGFMAIYILTKLKPPSVNINLDKTISIVWH